MQKPLGRPPKAAIIIPCYNCGDVIRDVVERCLRYSNDILLVNDGSDGDCAALLETLPARVIGWPDNRGKGAALLAGFRACLEQPGWDVLITVDGDGQHAPEDIDTFLRRYQETGAGLIIGRRDFAQSEVPLVRRSANQLSSGMISKLFDLSIHDLQCGFRLLDREAVVTLLPYLANTGFAMETEMVLWARRLGVAIDEAPVQCIYTAESHVRSSWKPLLDSWRIAKVVVRHWRDGRH